MRMTKLLTVLCATVLVTGCVTPTEREFGNAARAVNAGQTLNPNGTPAGEEMGDGQRLEGVVESYRKASDNRSDVGDDIRFGLGQGN